MFSHIQVKVSELKGNSDVIPRSGERSRQTGEVHCPLQRNEYVHSLPLLRHTGFYDAVCLSYIEIIY